MKHSEEHNLLSGKLIEVRTAVQHLYEEYHNGDQKLNKMIMHVKETLHEASALLENHTTRTAGDDDLIEKGKKYKALSSKIIGAVVTTAVGILVTLAFMGKLG